MIGTRIRLATRMLDDPDPIAVGATGTVTWHAPKSDTIPWEQVGVAWDDGRSLGLTCPPDRYEVIPTVRLNLRTDDMVEWRPVEVRGAETCEHAETLCATCVDQWLTDYEVEPDDVERLP